MPSERALKHFVTPAMLLLATAACGDSPVQSVRGEPAAILITAPDSLPFGGSGTASAVARDADDREIVDPTIAWSSAHEDIVRVDETGALAALRPGAALIRAGTGSAADSVWVTVVTTTWTAGDCEPIRFVDLPGNSFYGTYILPGRTAPPGTPSGHTEYHGIPFFWASGLVYGIHPDTTLVGYDWHGGNGLDDFEEGICAGDSAPSHTMALVRMQHHAVGTPATDVPGIVVAQEQFAYSDPDNDDYLLFRYTFTNTRTTPVTNLRAGVAVDYDMYEPDDDVGSFDPATGVAYAVAADSLTRTLSAAVFLIGRDVTSYFITRGGEPAPDRSDYYDWIASGTIDTGDGAVDDVRQILGTGPMTLAPGETATLWYVLAAGADRAALEQNIASARAKVAALD